MCPSISRRPVCPPDRWSISVPGRHPADRQSPGAEGSAIDIGYMASGLISMPARACASSDIGAIPRAYVPADIAGCRHTLRYRIRIMEHEYDEQHRVALKGDDDVCFMAAQGRSVCSSHCAANIVDVAVYRDVAVWQVFTGGNRRDLDWLSLFIVLRHRLRLVHARRAVLDSPGHAASSR